MTYKERFTASEKRAHNQNIATKILRELSQLRSSVDASPTTPKRWVWELIQNAKDVNLAGKVKINIVANLAASKPHVTFRHNGQPFTAENIRFLIEQISSKDRKRDDTGRSKTTGKFGTGFLTTHLLSEVVHVTGVAKEEGLAPKQFSLTLDRSGYDLEEITEAVDHAKASVENLDALPSYTGYVEGAFNTAFEYELTDETGLKVAQAGLRDLDTCLPYTLAFVREIETVKGPSGTFSLDSAPPSLDDKVAILSVTLDRKDDESTIFSIATISRGLTTIAVPVTRNDSGVRLITLGRDVPRLFCDFPLLGTESFPFPAIINNPNFNPTDARDGVFLTQTSRQDRQIDENRAVLDDALSLYLSLLDLASENGWQDLHLLAGARPIPSDLTWVDQDWYADEVLEPIREKLLQVRIVRTASDELKSIKSPEGKSNLFFPSAATKELRRAIWNLASSWFPHQLPRESDVEVWNGLIWDDCRKVTVASFAKWIEEMASVEKISESFAGDAAFDWLKEFYALLELDESEYDTLINRHRLFPNQNGELRKRSELFLESEVIDAALKDILGLLGNDVRATLIAHEIEDCLEDLAERDLQYVVMQITSEVQERTANRELSNKSRQAFSKLLRWFRNNDAQARKLFPVLYKQKHLLYDEDEIIENLERAEQLSALLREFQVENVQALRKVLQGQTHTPQLLPVTQEIIATMGITSVEEWAEALKDKELAVLFSHESTPTTDMFLFAQSLIEQAKESVKLHLTSLSEYDLTDIDETAPTIFAGVRKNDRPIMIVARPAYGNEVIIYYGSERDVLDFEESELWVDDGESVRRITLGHILKTAQIRKFPV